MIEFAGDFLLRMIPNKATTSSLTARSAETLRALGRRLTRPRRLVLDAVRATDAHPSAAAVYGRVRRQLPRVSLATVYRNLRMLAAEGFIRERADSAGLRFDGNLAPHDHFTCVVCGRVFDVPSARRRAARALRSATAGFEVFDHRIEFYGRCRACRGRGRSDVTPQRRTHGKARPQGQ